MKGAWSCLLRCALSEYKVYGYEFRFINIGCRSVGLHACVCIVVFVCRADRRES